MLNQEDIKKIIPHRYPFLFIDGITEIEPLKRVVGFKKVREDEYYFKGHFPEEPVMPGVLILEAISQVGAAALLVDETYKGKLILFAGADNVKFRRKVVPGDTLKLECDVLTLKRRFGSAQGRAYVDDQLACEAVIKFIIS
ncbi:MAG: 3-hydroxyacyl-ACP dehydratase FabZ [Acholeplasmataceae bacterium]|jgi:3-hydroxyacyl-[acyl-carrier-protein] dehydratase